MFRTFIFFSLEFRVIVPFTIWHSDLSFVMIRHSLPPCRRSERHSQPLEPSFTVWRSELCLRFGIQSHRPTQYSKPLSSFSFGVQSCHAYSFRHLESPYFLLLVFKVVFLQPCHSQSWLLAFMFVGVAHPVFMILHSSLFSLPRYLVLIAYSSCSSRLPLPLHVTQSFEFVAHILVMLLGTPHLAFSCSSRRAVPFGCILSNTRRSFDHYSSLTSIFRVTCGESHPSLRIRTLLFIC